MPHRKLFPKYPQEWAKHPDVLHERVEAIEDHLEQQSLPLSSASQGLFAPLMIVAVEILSALSLVSQSVRDGVLRALGH